MKKYEQIKQAIFSLDNPIMEMSNFILNLALINLLFVLTSLPVITIGISKTIFYRMLFKLNEHSHLPIISTYFEEWKKEWRQSIWLGLVEFILYSFILFDLYLISNQHSPWIAGLKVLGYASLFLISSIFLYVYPINAKYVMTNQKILKKSLLMTCLHGQWTIVSMLTLIIIVFIMQINFLIFYLILSLLCIIGCSMLGYIHIIILNQIFKNYQ
ncbi:DUF624 domain-containing protein [Atopobacter phocae]|uniref:DUF624 domain-containing protein n=1 Tax=Atopobacter phocae TaxID=136492 RepID=UPI0004722B6C|nr:DUF624 domain-containing protein [Atopobacter phocae]